MKLQNPTNVVLHRSVVGLVPLETEVEAEEAEGLLGLSLEDDHLSENSVQSLE